MAKKDTYIAGQTIHNRVEYDQNGNQVITSQIIYEQREFVEGYKDVKLPIRHKFGHGGFLTVFQEPLQAIVENGNLSKVEMQLFLWLMATLGVDGSIETNLDTISAALKQKKPNVSKALKGLVERNIVIRKDGRRYERSALPIELSWNYDQLNYGIVYNGKTALFKEKLRSHPAIELPCGDNKWVNTDTGEIIEDTNQ